MLFSKNKPIVLTAYTDNRLLAEMLAPKPAKAKLPKYYKTMPHSVRVGSNGCPVENSLEYQSTIRRCYGIHNFNTAGFLIPLWADYSIVTFNGNLSCAGAKGYAGSSDVHGNEQSPGVLDEFNALKLASPWVFRCSEEIQFLSVPNFYDSTEYADKFVIPPAVDDYSHQTSTNFFLLFNKNLPNQEIVLKCGTPLVKIVPLTERPVELKVELVEDVNRYRINPTHHIFSSSLSKLKKLAKDWNS